MKISLTGDKNILKRLDLEELHNWLLNKELGDCFKSHLLEQPVNQKETSLLSLLLPIDPVTDKIKKDRFEETIYTIKEGPLSGVPSNKMNVSSGRKRKRV